MLFRWYFFIDTLLLSYNQACWKAKMRSRVEIACLDNAFHSSLEGSQIIVRCEHGRWNLSGLYHERGRKINHNYKDATSLRDN